MLNKSNRGWLSLLLVASSVLLSIAAAELCRSQVAAESTTVAVEPADQTVDRGTSFTVRITVQDVADFGGYEFEMTFDPSVVEVAEVEDGGFLAETGRTVVPIGPEVDNEGGSMTFGAISVGDVSGAEGGGDVAVITLRAVGEGVTTLDLRSVQIYNTAGEEIGITVEDGRVQVGSSAGPTDTPTETATATSTAIPTATPTLTPTGQTATPTVPATQTPAEGATESPTATMTRTPTEPGTTVPTVTRTPTEVETTLPTATQAPTETPRPPTEVPTETVPATLPTDGPPSPTVEPSSTTEPMASPTEGRAAAEESPTSTRRRGDGTETASSDRQSWLIGGAAALGLLGLGLIIGGVYLFGPQRGEGQPANRDET